MNTKRGDRFGKMATGLVYRIMGRGLPLPSIGSIDKIAAALRRVAKSADAAGYKRASIEAANEVMRTMGTHEHLNWVTEVKPDKLRHKSK